MKQLQLNLLRGVLLTLGTFLFYLTALAQNLEIKGKVIDATTQKPIEGATVSVKGTNRATATDANGEFSINARQGLDIIVAFVGFETVTSRVVNNRFLTIEISPSTSQINEVVVTALGIKKESKRLAYSIQEVKAAEMLKAREANPVNNLAGKIAGLNVGINQELLASPIVLLRGNNVTFYVVDGQPINSDTWNISPDDIETFTVLKGPAASALYGNRGVNGAILITTKHGARNNKGWTVEVNSSNQINKGFIAIPKVQNEYGPGDYQKYAFGDGSGGGINDADYDVWGPILDGRLLPQYDGVVSPTQTYTTTFSDGSTFTGNIKPTPFIARGVNNMQKFLQAGFLTTNNINLSSVTDRSNVRMSVSQSYQRGITPNTSLNKVNFNLYGSYDVSDRLKVEGNLNYNRQFTDNIPDVTYGPNSIVYDIDIWMGADWNIDAPDIKNYWPAGGGAAGDRPTFAEYKHYQNPWFVSNEWLRGHYKNDIYGYLNLSYKLGNGFQAQLRSNVSTYDVLRTEKLPWWAHPYSQEYNNHGNYREDRRSLWENNTEALVKYNGDLGKSGFTLFAIAGVNARSFKYSSSWTTTNQLITPELYNFGNSLYSIQSYDFNSNMLVLSAYASADLTYKKYFTVSVTGREDESSALPVAHNAFFYPSASVSTVISDYVSLPKIISFLKVRASYANVKDGGTTPYIGATPTYNNGGFPLDYGGQYYSTYGGPSYNLTTPYQTSLGYNNQTIASSPSTIVNPNILPANHSSYEGGVDIHFLQNRIEMSATYFKYINGPQQYSSSISETSGYQSYLTNATKTDRSGGEISLQGSPIRGKKGFNWDVLVNWSTYREIYTSLPNNLYVDGNGYSFHKGDRVDLLTGNKEAKTSDGKLINDASGLPIYLPVAQALGHGDPDWSWGVNNKFSYKNFTFSFQFDGMVGGRIQDNVLRKLTEGGRGANTASGKLGEARYIEAYHYGDQNYKGAYDVNGKAILAEGVQIANGGALTFDALGHATNLKDLAYTTNNTATHWVQDYISSYYNDPEHTMTSKTFAKLREVVFTYSLPSGMLGKSMISRVDFSLVGRNLLYFFHKGFKDMDVDQYPGRDMFNNANREYGLQTPTTRSYGFNVNVVF
jgi:TonB-linked SusC/RagA family outer membrane protein